MNIKQVFDTISKKENHTFKLYELYTPETEFFVLDENSKKAKVSGMIVKDEPTIIIETTNGSFKVADKHVMESEDSQVWVENIKVGDKLKKADGSLVEVISVEAGEKELVYDLAIVTETHLYQDTNGFIHHNTFHVSKVLQDMKGSPKGPDATWRHYKGLKSSPFGLFKILFQYAHDTTIVFDDSDSVLANQDTINMLKSALDTDKNRDISWVSTMTTNVDLLPDADREEYMSNLFDALRDPEKASSVGSKDLKLPSTFEFTSNVIFISNMKGSKFDSNPDLSAIKSRSLFMDVTLSKEGTLERIKSIIEFVGSDISMDVKNEILDSLSKSNKKLTMRSITAGIAIKTADIPDWQRMVESYA